jgi:hypothetical protein
MLYTYNIYITYITYITYIYMYVYILCIQYYINVIYIYIYIYIYIHTYIHTYIAGDVVERVAGGGHARHVPEGEGGGCHALGGGLREEDEQPPHARHALPHADLVADASLVSVCGRRFTSVPQQQFSSVPQQQQCAALSAQRSAHSALEDLQREFAQDLSISRSLSALQFAQGLHQFAPTEHDANPQQVDANPPTPPTPTTRSHPSPASSAPADSRELVYIYMVYI